MDRRQCLKRSLAVGAHLTLPAGLSGLAGCSPSSSTDPAYSAIDGRIMGTGYRVLLTSEPDAALPDDVLSTLQEVDVHMSTWRADSELARFNASVDMDWQPMSAVAMHVIAHAVQASEQSGGAFDATVGPLVDLWGFGPGATDTASNARPSLRALQQTRARIGHHNIEIDVGNRALRKRRPDAQLDLSGIAKGFAVDRVAQLLKRKAHANFLVNVGGELRARGGKLDGAPWRVAIERPGDGPREAQQVIALEDRAVATSGNYRHYFELGERRYSHVIDPRTGEPVDHSLASVTVVAATTMEADALSTTLMIMGLEQGMEFAETHGIAAQMITRHGTALHASPSPAFTELDLIA